MLESTNQPLTYLRFGIQRKKEFLRDVRNAYDGLVLPANILLYQYRATPAAVFMCERPFFVDTMSYLFGQPYEHFKQRAKKGGYGFKPSFQRLMEGHGLAPAEYLNYDYTALLRTLGQTPGRVSDFADQALSLQWNKVWETLQEAKDLMTPEQRELLKEETFRPRFLMPPYFLYAPSGAQSLTTGINHAILEHCWNQRDQWGDIFPMVFIRKAALGSSFLEQVITSVRARPFPGYCVWIEDFDEREVTATQVSEVVALSRALAEGGRQVVMLYGGFFSMLLYHFGMTCVCHGLAYGEARALSAAAQQSSGPAPVRYYVLELHTFLTLPNALEILRERPDLVCTCPVCRRVLGGNPENIMKFAEEEELAEMHFLWNRNQERRMIGENSIEDLVKHLEWTLELNEDIVKITRPYKVNASYEERAIIDPKFIRAWRDGLRGAA